MLHVNAILLQILMLDGRHMLYGQGTRAIISPSRILNTAWWDSLKTAFLVQQGSYILDGVIVNNLGTASI